MRVALWVRRLASRQADLAGGALYAWNSHGTLPHGSTPLPLNVTVEGGTFVQNRALNQWGGALANWHSSVFVHGALFDGNAAAVMGGALWTDAASTSDVSASALTANNAAPAGGAVWSHPKGSTVLALHNTFRVHSAKQGRDEAKWFSGCRCSGKGGVSA